MYWKTKTIDGKFHMVKGDRPNKYWEEYDPDYDTERYYKSHGLIKDHEGKSEYAIIEIIEDEI